MTQSMHATTRRGFVAGAIGSLALGGAGPADHAIAQDSTPSASPAAPPTGVETLDMTAVSHEFQVGSYRCLSVSDGAITGPFVATVIFGGMAEEDAQAIVNETGIDPSELVSQFTSTVIDTGSELVLYDTGSPGLPGTGILVDNLERVGIRPADIDVVALSHGHLDHIGGNLTPDGDKTFPNARYVMVQQEWDFWTDERQVEDEIPNAELRRSYLTAVERDLLPLADEIELIGYDEDIAPGVTSVDSHGHTPGHLSLLVESDDERLWTMGGSASTALNLQYPHMMGPADMEPEVVVATRERLFSEIAEGGDLAVFTHFDPFPSIGHIVAEGDAWAWQPVGAA